MKAMQCQRCGKTVQVPPTKEKGFRFCSKECRHAACNTLKTCLNCGKQYMVHNSRAAEGKGNYCSKACLESHTGSGWEERTCKVCGEPFQSRKGKIHGWLTCSKACANAAKASANTKRIYKKLGSKPVDQTQKVAVACDRCGNIHYRFPSRIYKHNYCSEECRIADAPRRSAKILANARQACSRKYPTKLEKKLFAILDSLGATYERYPIIKSKFTVDCRVGLTVIQADGDYWHGHPRFEPLTERQLAQQKRDKAQDKYLKARGYAVVRIWECEMSTDHVKQALHL